MWQICRGELLPPEKCEEYRKLWDSLKNNKRGPCLYRGDRKRLQTCETCSGKVQIKVFECSIHGECTPAKVLPGIQCCRGCGDYLAATQEYAKIPDKD
jgi:hypothetical protein